MLFARIAGLLLVAAGAVLPADRGDEPGLGGRAAAVRPLLVELDKRVKAGRVVGAQLLVGDRHGVVMNRCFGIRGPADPTAVDRDTQFCIGSCSKPFAAACLLRLAADEKVNLDVPIDRWLPEFRSPRLATGAKARRCSTARELLTNRGGVYSQKENLSGPQVRFIRDFRQTLAESVRGIAAEPLIAEPGTRFAYSGAGYCVAGRVAEAAVGSPFDTVFHDTVARPLGLRRTGYFVHPKEQNVAVGGSRRGGRLVPDPLAPHAQGADHRFPLVGGGLYSTAEDMAVFARMVLAGGRGRDAVVLPAAACKDFLKQQVADGSYGLGWVMEIGPDAAVVEVQHGGALAAYRSVIRIDLAHGSYLVLNWTIVVPTGDEGAAELQPFNRAARRVLRNLPRRDRRNREGRGCLQRGGFSPPGSGGSI